MLTSRLSPSDQAQPFRWPFPPHGRTEEAPAQESRPRDPALLVLREVPARGAQAHRQGRRLHQSFCTDLRRVRGDVQRDHLGSWPSGSARLKSAGFVLAGSAQDRRGRTRTDQRRHGEIGGRPFTRKRDAALALGRPSTHLRYDSPVTGPTVAGRGNPKSQHCLSREGQGTRACAPFSMAAPSGASFGWAGSLVPVFHPRLCAAARPHGGPTWFDS